MPSWPGTLPSPTIAGYSEKEADNLVASQMAVGPMKVRRRSSSPRSEVQARYILTAAQRDTLRSFFRTSTAYGSLSFDMNGGVYLFAPGLPPVFTPLGGGIWEATCSFLRIA